VKTLTLLILLTFSQSAIAGGWASGGGDPKEVEAKVFPFMGKIIDAVNLLKSNLDKTPFNENFKNAFKKDLDLLLKNGRFYYVPELFAVGFNRHPGDYTKLYSNGAMTEFKLGAPIYFSKQAIKYDVRTLARVIGQEVPHHIFKGRFQRDETFANNLGTYLVLLDKIPTEPYSAAQIIYEEFDHELRDDSSKRIIQKARDEFNAGENVLEVLYNLAHRLYKNRGSFSDYHVETAAPMTRPEMYRLWPKTADISALTKLKKTKIAECMFATYQDGASGITKQYQALLTDTFLKLMDEFKSKIKKVYTTEEFYLPMEKVVTTCGFGIEDDAGKVYLYKAIIRHEDNQCGGEDNPCDIPPPIGL
tara:strand:- start:45088 stop:46170 length:1083 start_codon:yes stop_codon:yes gene_type:complete